MRAEIYLTTDLQIFMSLPLMERSLLTTAWENASFEDAGHRWMGDRSVIPGSVSYSSYLDPVICRVRGRAMNGSRVDRSSRLVRSGCRYSACRLGHTYTFLALDAGLRFESRASDRHADAVADRWDGGESRQHQLFRWSEAGHSSRCR